MIDLFKTYKDSCRIRINSCKDGNMKQRTLESMVTELLEQNELLVNSVVQLQNHLNSKDSNKSSTKGNDSNNASSSRDTFSQQMNAGEIIAQMNQHLAQLQIENEFLREKNDNLEHDLNNLLKILEVEHEAASATADAGNPVGELTNKLLLTFCDSVNPEDVFGPIESIESIDHLKEQNIESTKCQVTASRPQAPPMSSLQSRACDSAPRNDTTKCTSLNMPSNATGDLCSSFAKMVTEPIAASNLQLVLEEKQLLIDDLQQHLETISKRASLADEVIRKVELKLRQKRHECNEWRSKAFENQRRVNDVVRENMELKQREYTLLEQKRCLLTRLDEQSDEYFRCKEELSVMKQRVIHLTQQADYQAATIEHLKESVVSKTKALHSISSGNLLSNSQSNPISLSPRAHSNSGGMSKTMQI